MPETTDAVSDHNEIRDACRRADRMEPGSRDWWCALGEAREHNSTHMVEEERGPLRDLRTATLASVREEAGAKWQAFMSGRLNELAAGSHDKNPDAYVAVHQGSS